MAITLTPEEEIMVLRKRLAEAESGKALNEERYVASQWERAGADMRAAGQTGSVAPAPANAGGTKWGGMIAGAKTIVKYVVVATVLTVGFLFLSGFLSAFVAANPGFLPGIMGPLSSSMDWVAQGIIGLWKSSAAGLSSVGSYFTSAAAGGAGISGSTVATASALGVGGAVVSAKLMGNQLAAVPDVDHSALLAAATKKTVASQAATAQPNSDALFALPDSPNELRSASDALQSAQAQQAATHSKTAAIKTAAHVAADETHDAIEQRSKALDRVRQAQADRRSWVERIAEPAEPSLGRS